MAENDDKKKALDWFLHQAKCDEDKARLEEAFNLSLKEFTLIAHSELGFECPRGWTPCPNGDCVPPGVLCD